METVAGAVISALPSSGPCQPTPAPTLIYGSSGERPTGAHAGGMLPMCSPVHRVVASLGVRPLAVYGSYNPSLPAHAVEGALLNDQLSRADPINRRLTDVELTDQPALTVVDHGGQASCGEPQRRVVDAEISDAEQHRSDPPEAGVSRVRRRTMVQVPAFGPPGGMGSVFAESARGPVFDDLLDALGHEAPAVDGVYVRFFKRCSVLGLNPVRKTGHPWRSMSVRGGGGSRGVLSFWRGECGHNMVVYRDGEMVLAWFDAFRGSIDPRKWAKMMHSLIGNIPTSNRFAVLAGLGGEDAMAAAENIGSEDDVVVDSAEGSECASEEGADLEERADVVRVIPDEAVYKGVDVIGRVFVKAFKRFNVNGDPRSAGLWNDAHRMIDSSKTEQDKPLHKGPRFPTVNQPGKEAKRTQGTKKKKSTRSPGMKIRDAARVAEWLGKMDPAVAEGWVRANKPMPNQVPRSTEYLDAYAEGRTRGAFYGPDRVDDAVGLIDQFLYDGITGSVAYLGPKTRALIQSLLVIGNIELHPGPVPGLDGGNFGHDGSDLELAYAAGVRFLLTHGLTGDRAALSGNVRFSPGVLPILAQPHVVPHTPVAGGDHVSLGAVGGLYVVSIAWPDAQGTCLGGSYERVWAGGQWTVEYAGVDGAVTVFPDLDGLAQQCRLMGKISVRDADGKIDIKIPSVVVYDTTPGGIPRRVADRRVTVVVGGIQIHYYRGCNYVAICCPGQYGCSGFVPTSRWGECEKLFAAGHSRQVAANNVTQVLRTCDDLPGNMLGLVQLAISEAMLPAAMVVASVSSTHRDAAINRARLGKGPRTVWDVAINGGVSSPEYGHMVNSSPDAPWQAVWATRAAIVVGVGIGVWAGHRYVTHSVGPYVTRAYCSLRDEAVRAVRESRVPIEHVYEEAIAGYGFDAYTDGGYELSPEYFDSHIPVRSGVPLSTAFTRFRQWLAAGCVQIFPWDNVPTLQPPPVTPPVCPPETDVRLGLRALEYTSWVAERCDYAAGVPVQEHLLMYVAGRACYVFRRFLELTQTVRDYLEGAPEIRVSQESVCVFVAYVIGGAPTWEEIAKRRSWIFYIGIPTIEAIALVNVGWTPGWALVNRFGLHCGFSALPLWAGILVHGSHNLACFALHRNLQVGNSSLVYALAPLAAVVALRGVEYVVEKGERWWSSSPMGVESQFDDLFGTEHVAEPDPLLKPIISARKPRYGKRSRNEVYQLFPSVLDMASFSNERGNYVHSMHGRVGKKTPEITDDVGLAEIKVVLRSLADSVRARKGLVEPLPFDEFVSKFGPGKQQLYREARELFDVVGTRPIMHPARFKDFKADECAAFLKHELNAERPDVVKVFGGVRYQYAPGDPRTICPRWLPFQSVMIPYVLAMEANVKEELRTRSPELFGVEVRFASGLSIEEMSAMCGALMRDSGLDCIIDNGDDGMFTVNGVAYYVDGQRWDAHFRREYHHEIIDCYARMGLPSYLSDAMHKLVYRKLNWGQGVRCEIDRNNASGESDTTFRNGLGNFVVKLIALRRCGRLTGPNGVDFVATATRLGFVYEVAAEQRVYNDPLGDFCARVWLGRQLVLKPGRIFAKLCWTCSPSIPFVELRAAKLRAAILDFRAFPEVSSVLARLVAHCGDATTRGMAVVAAARYGVIGSEEASTFEERCTFFALRYGVSYQSFLVDVEAWVEAAGEGEFELSLPTLRRVAEFDMGVTSVHAVAATTERKLVNAPDCMSLRSARARRLNEAAASARARPAWLARMWARIMHSLIGNGKVRMLLLGWALLVFVLSVVEVSAGWAGGRNLIPEQTLSYQRQQSMPRGNKKNNQQAKQQQPRKSRQTQASNEARRQLNATARSLDVSRKRVVPIPRSVAGYSGLTERWRRSLLDPFNTPGCVAAGDFYVRNAVPYTIKRNIQLSTTTSGACSILCHPSLNCMMWNPDGLAALTGPAGYSFYTETVAAQDLANGSGKSPTTAVKLAAQGTGLSCPQMASLFSRHRIVSWGVRVRFDGNFTTGSGKVVCATVPYEGYLPVGSYNSGSPGVYIDVPYDNGTSSADGDQVVYSAHPASAPAKRRFACSALVADMGLPTTLTAVNAPVIPSAVVVGLPQTETFMINEIAGKVFECQPRPCSSKLWDWRDPGVASSITGVGTAAETIGMSAGTEVFPGSLTLYNQGGGAIGNMLLPPLACDTSCLQAKGFESVCLCFDGLPLNAPICDVELVYNIEAIPAVAAGVVVPGCQPAAAGAIRRQAGESRATAEEMLQHVSAKPDKMIVSAGEALVGLAQAAATSGLGGVAAQAATFAMRSYGGSGGVGRRQIGN